MRARKIEFSALSMVIRTERYTFAAYPNKTAEIYTYDKSLADEIAARDDAEEVRCAEGLYIIKLKNSAVGRYVPVP
jgi:hypothetical protein